MAEQTGNRRAAGFVSRIKRLLGRPEATGALYLEPGLQPGLLVTRSGKSWLSDAIDSVLASSGAEPGDIVEVDEHGVARVVGRGPHLAGASIDFSEQSIRARLSKIYGAEAASMVDVTAGSNVLVVRKREP